MAASALTPGAPPGSIDALKRVKATEAEWEIALRAAKGTAEATIQRLRADSDAAVKAAQAEADAERARVVQAARAEADRQAAEILAEGKRAAEAVAGGEGKSVVDRKDALLALVLAGFGKD
jgi:vacuolar-type H+-ATPase subunit H